MTTLYAKRKLFRTSSVPDAKVAMSSISVDGGNRVSDLPIIQKTYDLIKWYVPILNRLPRDHKFALGERIVAGLYNLLEGLIRVRYAREKLPQLQTLNTDLEILRHQTRLLLDFDLLSVQRYEYVGQQMNSIGIDLGSWIKQQRER